MNRKEGYMNDVVDFLNEKGFTGGERYSSEKDPTVKSIQDFFFEEKRITIVELVDKYQVMVYNGKHIHSSTQPDGQAVLGYLKGTS
jgi:hypothetical protein